ncbi:hypothetical protein [Rhizobium laguerreae]|uniref:hypothetical protein n=1 Tax=Rhizobium laguerreae TaxID=1076926 RepID=UPI0014413121|nr:hypothetical protein [Rhizobium laguerreae]NKM69155.1 hypothetical protein [Rhizobium laguerreae]
MPYATRQEDGAISGIYEQRQDGLAEEYLAGDDAALLAFLSKPVTVLAVSARQFKLQLLSAGLLDEVDTWVAQQSREIQIAYEYSGTFIRDSAMMGEGFAAMGFSAQQIDAFFQAAAAL